MSINIFQWQETISKPVLGRGLRNNSDLRERVSRLLRRSPISNTGPTTTNLQNYIDLYGEQVTKDAVGDLGKYFTFIAIRMGTFTTTVGGVPTGSLPLAISFNDIRPSNTSISVIGEGLAGWYLQNVEGLNPLTRPTGKRVDLLFEARIGYAFVQVKTTTQQDVKPQMREAYIPILDFAGKVVLEAYSSAYICYIIGVIIKPANDFDLLSLGTAIV